LDGGGRDGLDFTHVSLRNNVDGALLLLDVTLGILESRPIVHVVGAFLEDRPGILYKLHGKGIDFVKIAWIVAHGHRGLSLGLKRWVCCFSREMFFLFLFVCLFDCEDWGMGGDVLGFVSDFFFDL
jgi:hypothetical protein